ncbi:MAG: hypothetical protein K2I80_08180 [Ruminococcus sp.]|nr:hypothetical protein [Ruminococcus sp.]MDE6848801.1 hypothetical protein [Ruminococcus sp.]
MTKKIFFLSLIIMTAFCFCSCESNGRVHDKNYLRAVSVSGNDEKTVTFTFFTKDGKYITTSGKDIDSAKKLAELQTGRKIFTGYTEMILVDDLNSIDTLEYMLHKWKVSPSCIVVYAGEDAEAIFANSTVERLYGSVKTAVKQGKSPECDIITVLGELLNNKKSAEIAEITSDGAVSVHTIN